MACASAIFAFTGCLLKRVKKSSIWPAGVNPIGIRPGLLQLREATLVFSSCYDGRSSSLLWKRDRRISIGVLSETSNNNNQRERP